MSLSFFTGRSWIKERLSILFNSTQESEQEKFKSEARFSAKAVLVVCSLWSSNYCRTLRFAENCIRNLPLSLWTHVRQCRFLKKIQNRVERKRLHPFKHEVWESGAAALELVGFCQLGPDLTYLERKKLNWEKASLRSAYRQVCRALSWLMIDVVGCGPLGGIPDFCCGHKLYKKAGQASHIEQARKQHCSMASASRFFSWIPSVMDCGLEI